MTPKGREYLENGKKQSKKQAMLIRDILNAFAAEVESHETFILDSVKSDVPLAKGGRGCFITNSQYKLANKSQILIYREI